MKKILPLVIASILSVTSFSVLSKTPIEYQPNQVISQQNDKMVIKHQLGETTVAKNPSKVVLFDFGLYDSLVQLGLADKVVGLPLGNAPAYIKGSIASNVANVGGMKAPDLEKLAEIKPDLIIITGRQGASYEALAKIAPTVNLGTNSANYLNSVESNIKLLGELFDKQQATQEQIAKLNAVIEQAQKKATGSDKKVLVLLHNAGNLIPNNQSVVYDVVKAKRAELPPVAEEDKGKRRVVTSEMIAKANPDVIFIVDRSEAIGADKLEKNAFEDDAIKTTSAYKNGGIVYLQADLWYLSGGGLDSLAKQIEAVESAL
ncbi:MULTISPECIES: siderophore ABC transporter substrate-binding protein [Proteus]|uniref:Putative ABC transporter solute-binding protein YclQ n=1 Tax=Proteus penneri TaxID=102862 RepID=A0A0G4Q755_9GAMM|nr:MULTISPECIES: siderophore ABC transporter substrate-binding protein [Proteus]NBM80388.1 ABC transporter substrate-binding protein [Proteus sp. G2659]CRL61461.1 putative ABC transporter solute-binding protein YclQ precursor [Proteus penneri]